MPSGVVVAYERVLGTDFERLQVVARAPASAYGRMRRAELLATHGDKGEAHRALALADVATEAADGIEPPASMYWWSTGFGASGG